MPGRRKLTPIEKVSLTRVESIILLGIYIAVSKQGGSATDAINIMMQHLNLPPDLVTVRQYRRQLNDIHAEFRCIMKTSVPV